MHLMTCSSLRLKGNSCSAQLLHNRNFAFVWIAMPCESFSIARKNDGVGPPPLRSDKCPMGLRGLRAHDRRKLHYGNLLLYFSCRVLCVCELLGIPYVFENPASSRCWNTPLLKQIFAGRNISFVNLDFCQYDTRWRKSTTLMCHGIQLQSLGRTCKGTSAACSATGKPHVRLHGLAADGRFLTLLAQPYPYKLVKEIANVVLKQLF